MWDAARSGDWAAKGAYPLVRRAHGTKAGVLGLGAIGMAVATVQVAKPGVYIVMSGQVFEAGAVRKNRAENCFEAT